MTRNPTPDPAADLVPPVTSTRREEPAGASLPDASGRAAAVPPRAAAAPTSSRQAVSPDSLPDGRPGPETTRPGPVSVRAGDQTPAGASDSDSPPAGTSSSTEAPEAGRGGRPGPGRGVDGKPRPGQGEALGGEEWRKRVKDVTSAQHAEARRRATRYVPKAKRGAASVSGPGMVRRMPPPLPPDGAA